VFLLGQGLWSPWYAGTSLLDLDRDFGRNRVIDSPVSENATTGAAIGAAIAGMRPIVFHPRMDFMLLAVDPIVNQAANWSYMFSGKVPVPLVIRTVINRGGEQGAQHSQALQAMFTHIPGLKVVMPSTAYDAKGLLIAAVQDLNPVIYIDDRWLYAETDDVPETMYSVQLGKAVVRREGKDVTVVATSYMASQSLMAVSTLEDEGIDVELIDLRSVKPWDFELVYASLSKTGRLVVADAAWACCGIAAEIAASVAERAFNLLKAPIIRITLPDAPAPASAALEKAYYVGASDIIVAVHKVLASTTKHTGEGRVVDVVPRSVRGSPKSLSISEAGD
jgi:pyruvate dehydrogenase E1 component beta subunit